MVEIHEMREHPLRRESANKDMNEGVNSTRNLWEKSFTAESLRAEPPLLEAMGMPQGSSNSTHAPPPQLLLLISVNAKQPSRCPGQRLPRSFSLVTFHSVAPSFSHQLYHPSPDAFISTPSTPFGSSDHSLPFSSEHAPSSSAMPWS